VNGIAQKVGLQLQFSGHIFGGGKGIFIFGGQRHKFDGQLLTYNAYRKMTGN